MPELAPAPAQLTRPPRRRWRRLAWVVLAALVGLPLGLRGLVRHDPLDPAYAGPRPLTAKVAARFAYPELGSPAAEVASFNHVAGARWSTRWVHLLVTTPGQAEPHRVQVIHYRPAGLSPGQRRPAVVITPILGARDELPGLLGAALAASGIHGAVVLRAETILDPRAPDARIERVLRTAVVDRRRTVDWLEGLPDVDPARIGACGASLGGIATALLCAVEPRVQAGALLLAGGDLPLVLASSDEPRVVRWRAARGAHSEGPHSEGQGPEPLRAALAAAIPSDPLGLAPAVDARRLLFVQARFDGAVPTSCQERLWEALGRPRRYLLPTGHRSAGVYLPWLIPLLVEFFQERLGPTDD